MERDLIQALTEQSAALLHAILAITARYLPKHLLSTWAYRPAQTHADYYLAHQQTPLYHFQTFHRDTAVALLPATMHKPMYRSADLVTGKYGFLSGGPARTGH